VFSSRIIAIRGLLFISDRRLAHKSLGTRLDVHTAWPHFARFATGHVAPVMICATTTVAPSTETKVSRRSCHTRRTNHGVPRLRSVPGTGFNTLSAFEAHSLQTGIAAEAGGFRQLARGWTEVELRLTKHLRSIGRRPEPRRTRVGGNNMSGFHDLDRRSFIQWFSVVAGAAAAGVSISHAAGGTHVS
jgi:hypothetical protein